MKKGLVGLMSWLMIFSGCEKVPEDNSKKAPLPVQTQSVPQEREVRTVKSSESVPQEKGVKLIEPYVSLPLTRTYSIKEEESSGWGPRYRLIGNGKPILEPMRRPIIKYRDETGVVPEGMPGHWGSSELVQNNPEYDFVSKDLYLETDNTLTYQLVYGKQVVESGWDSVIHHYEPVEKTKPIYGVWEKQGDTLEIKLTHK